MKFHSRVLTCSLAVIALACAGLPALAAPIDDPGSQVQDEQIVTVAVPGATSLHSAQSILAAKTSARSRRSALASTAEIAKEQRAASRTLVEEASEGSLTASPQPTTVEEEQALANRSTQTYDESESSSGARAMNASKATAKDYMTKKQCLSSAAANTADGYFKNHWSWCQFIPVIMTRYVNGRQTCEIYFETTLIGKGYAGSRKVTFKDYIDNVALGGSWPRGGTNLHISMDCKGFPNPDHCDAHGSKTFFLDKDFDTAHVNITINPTAVGARGTGKRSVGLFNPRYEADNASPVGAEHGYESGFRCDSASYIGSKGACIFDRIIGTFQLDRKDSKVNAAAKHIYSAQHASDSAKRSPSVLTRATSKDLQKRNTIVAHAACRKISKDTPKGKDCDEYPFKTTYQGAANAGKHFSVKYITSGDNREAGRRLGSWFTADRILDGDAFNVWIR